MNFEHLYFSPIIEMPVTDEKCRQDFLKVQQPTPPSSPPSYQECNNNDRLHSFDSSRCNLLPSDFVPSPYSVIFGRGKKCTEACGNRRLKVIASMYLHRYATASNKDTKSEIVTEIQATVLSANNNKVGTFIRQARSTTKSNNGGGSAVSPPRWYEVEGSIVREKISQILRDLLHTKYRSSLKNKVEERRKKRRRDMTDDIMAVQQDSITSNIFDDIFNGRVESAEQPENESINRNIFF